MVTAPTITIRIAMTIATIGRLMKNFDISAAFRGGRGQLNLDSRAVPNLLQALHNHELARLDAAFQDPHRIHAFSDFDRPDAHLVVTAYHRDLVAPLEFRYRP